MAEQRFRGSSNPSNSARAIIHVRHFDGILSYMRACIHISNDIGIVMCIQIDLSVILAATNAEWCIRGRVRSSTVCEISKQFEYRLWLLACAEWDLVQFLVRPILLCSAEEVFCTVMKVNCFCKTVVKRNLFCIAYTLISLPLAAEVIRFAIDEFKINISNS